MNSAPSLQKALPAIVSAVIVVVAGIVLYRTMQRIDFADVLLHLRAIPGSALAVAGLLVATVFAGIALYETIVVRWIGGAVGPGLAALTALIAAPIGHAVGWGALSGGAIRYRIYYAAGMRPLDVGKLALLAPMPYAAGLGFLLGLSLLLQTHEAAEALRVDPAVARGTGLALLALHAAYVALVVVRKQPLPIGRFLLTLPPLPITGVQYFFGILEVCAAAGALYVLLPASADLSFLAFVGVYVLCILAALASSVPAGLGVFESVLILLLPRVPPDELLGAVLAYRFILELVPFAIAAILFAGYEAWARLPAQRRAAEERRAAAAAAARGD